MKKRFIITTAPTVIQYYDGNDWEEDLVGIGDPDFNLDRFTNAYRHRFITGPDSLIIDLTRALQSACNSQASGYSNETEIVAAIVEAISKSTKDLTGHHPVNSELLTLYKLISTLEPMSSGTAVLEGRRALLTAATGYKFDIRQMNRYDNGPMTYLGPADFDQGKLDQIELLLRGLAQRCFVSEPVEEDTVLLPAIRSMVTFRNVIPVSKSSPFTGKDLDILVQRQTPWKDLSLDALKQKVADQVGGSIEDYLYVGYLSPGWRIEHE